MDTKTTREAEASGLLNPELMMINNVRGHFEHRCAVVEKDVTIGKGTRVWAFAHILPGAIIGENCNICDHVFIEGRVSIGNRVTIKTGVSLWDGVLAADDVFIGPHVVFANDLRPRSRVRPPSYPWTVLKQGCSLGANCTILPGLIVGSWAMVGAGAVVTRNIPDYSLVVGVPGRFRGWICRCGKKLHSTVNSSWACSCGRQYEQIAEKEIRELLISNGNGSKPRRAARSSKIIEDLRFL